MDVTNTKNVELKFGCIFPFPENVVGSFSYEGTFISFWPVLFCFYRLANIIWMGLNIAKQLNVQLYMRTRVPQQSFLQSSHKNVWKMYRNDNKGIKKHDSNSNIVSNWRTKKLYLIRLIWLNIVILIWKMKCVSQSRDKQKLN